MTLTRGRYGREPRVISTRAAAMTTPARTSSKRQSVIEIRRLAARIRLWRADAGMFRLRMEYLRGYLGAVTAGRCGVIRLLRRPGAALALGGPAGPVGCAGMTRMRAVVVQVVLALAGAGCGARWRSDGQCSVMREPASVRPGIAGLGRRCRRHRGRVHGPAPDRPAPHPTARPIAGRWPG
jgi:hypothetical protein